MRLSSDFAKLAEHYEVLVVGSGYGGAIAASRMARAFRTVCVLERGREWLPPDFPKTTAEMLDELQLHFPSLRKGPRTGLYEFRFGDTLVTYLGCGVGGGSLVNAGVTIRPDPELFDDPRWPRELRRDPA